MVEMSELELNWKTRLIRAPPLEPPVCPSAEVNRQCVPRPIHRELLLICMAMLGMQRCDASTNGWKLLLLINLAPLADVTVQDVSVAYPVETAQLTPDEPYNLLQLFDEFHLVDRLCGSRIGLRQTP